MLIDHAILGLLSLSPLSGYEMKKIMQESSFLYWSGNNNQIYRALTKLKDDGLVQSETFYDGEGPTKKIYTITEEGVRELHKMSLAEPEAFEGKKTFLVQLAFCGMLSRSELNDLFDRYETNVRGGLMIEKKRAQQKDGFFSGSKSLLENQLWEAIHENIISGYVSELAWIERVRKQVLPLAKSSMNQQEPQLRYQKVIDGSQIIVKSDPSSQLTSEKDGVTLVGFCAESDSNLILIPRACLTERFYDLSTGVAGEILQKLTNYGIRAAIVSDRTEATGEWKQFITEINRGNAFHVCADEKQALEWLSKGGEKQ